MTKKILIILLIPLIIIISLIITFYVSKITNKPCIQVIIDCDAYKIKQPHDQCIQGYEYCGPEALLDLLF